MPKRLIDLLTRPLLALRRPAVAVAVVLAGVLPPVVESSSTRQLEADKEVDAWRHGTQSQPRAFVKDGRLRLFFTNEAPFVLLQAKWKSPRVETHGFSFASATLEAAKSASNLTVPASGWREVRTLTGAESDRVARATVERLVPLQPGHGIQCRHAYGDTILFRDSGGGIQTRPALETPADLQIDRRYSRPELAAAVGEAMEAELPRVFPNESGVLLILSGTNQWRLLLVDLAERQAAVLSAPHLNQDPRRSPTLALKLSNLASFVLVDNLWTFLKNPVSSSARTLNQMHQWVSIPFEPRLRKRAGDIPPVTEGPGMDLGSWEAWLDKSSHSRRELGSIRWLIDGDRFFPLLQERISQARRKVDLHVCIFDRDDVAVDFADLVKQRSTNLEVKVIFDRLNSRGAGKAAPATPMPAGFSPPSSISSYLRKGANVQLRPQPNPGFTCDHTKVFLIDAQYAYVGGMNVGREYRYEWHDMMAEIEGPVVASFQQQFDKKWAQVGPWGDCGLVAASLGATAAEPNSNRVGLVPLRRLYTKTFDRQIRRAELGAIDRASQHVYLENAYLYNDALIVALVRARARGVDVRVIMPSDNDFGAGHKSNLVTANYLLQHGVRVYFYPGMSHIKALEVDGWVCFGSANFDALSLRLNREADLATSDPSVARSIRRELFEPDFAKSHELKETIATSFGDHLADTLLNPF